MEVASRTLREVEFRQQLRGYHQDDVDEFLERVAAGIEVLQDRLREAQERAARAEQRLNELRAAEPRPPAAEVRDPVDTDTVHRTLILAQRTADLAIKEAKEEASQVVSEARARARAMLNEAEQAAHQRVEESEQQLRAEVARLTAARAELTGQLTSLEQHLERERARVGESLTQALKWLSEHLPGPTPRPDQAGAGPSGVPSGGRGGREVGPPQSWGPEGSRRTMPQIVPLTPGGSSTTGPGQGQPATGPDRDGEAHGGRPPEPSDPSATRLMPRQPGSSGGAVYDADSAESGARPASPSTERPR